MTNVENQVSNTATCGHLLSERTVRNGMNPEIRRLRLHSHDLQTHVQAPISDAIDDNGAEYVISRAAEAVPRGGCINELAERGRLQTKKK